MLVNCKLFWTHILWYLWENRQHWPLSRHSASLFSTRSLRTWWLQAAPRYSLMKQWAAEFKSGREMLYKIIDQITLMINKHYCYKADYSSQTYIVQCSYLCEVSAHSALKRLWHDSRQIGESTGNMMVSVFCSGEVLMLKKYLQHKPRSLVSETALGGIQQGSWWETDRKTYFTGTNLQPTGPQWWWLPSRNMYSKPSNSHLIHQLWHLRLLPVL